MNLITVQKECTIEQLQAKGFEFPKVADWVSIELNGEEIETNRYDVEYDNELSVYIYFNEDSNFIYAIDDITQDLFEDVGYIMRETSIYKQLKALNLIDI